MTIALGILVAFVSFTLSACVGLGGSLLLVPAMMLVFGTKQGIVIAAILLSFNNVGKVIAYRKTLPLSCAPIVVLTVLGATVGASALLSAEEIWVDLAVFSLILLTFVSEIAKLDSVRSINAPAMAFFSGCTSGFAGTSGPLKGVAIRNLGLERMYFVGAASIVSLFGDVAKVVVYSGASLLDQAMWAMVIVCIVLSPVAVVLGREINRKLGEMMFAGVFWAVMCGYTLRLFLR